MATKKWKGRICVYCGTAPSTTGDHVFARQFFPVAKRGNLPQVPACESCNSEKSGHETYLMAVLPFGARHTDAAFVLGEMVPARLEKNAKLRAQLAHGKKQGWSQTPSGILMPTMTLPFDTARVEALFRYIVRGLLWHHWQVMLTDEDYVEAGFLNPHAEFFLGQFLQGKANACVEESLGDGAFSYRGVQGTDRPSLSVWQFKIYGGIQLGDDPNSPGVTVDTLWGTSSRLQKVLSD